MEMGASKLLLLTFAKFTYVQVYFCMQMGAQWLSGRVLDLRPMGRGFEPHQHHCVVSLSKIYLSLLSTGSTQEDLSQHNWKNVDWDVKNQNQTKQKYANQRMCMGLYI